MKNEITPIGAGVMDEIFEAPTLIGSARQVEWAAKIRAQKMDALYERANEAEKRARAADKYRPEDMHQIDTMLAWVEGHTEATWWIDNQHQTCREFFLVAKEAIGLPQRRETHDGA